MEESDYIVGTDDYRIKTYHLALSVCEDVDEDDGWEEKVVKEGPKDAIVKDAISNSYAFEDVYTQWGDNGEFPVLAVVEKDKKPISSFILYGNEIKDIDKEVQRMRDSFEEFIKQFKEAYAVYGKGKE